MKVSERLLKIAAKIQDGEALMDIGCDHALLDIYLAKNKHLMNIIAADISEGPLNIAKRNIEKYECQGIIKVVKSDGLEKITPDINTVIIAGLGAKAIIDILKKDQHKLGKVDKLVIVPNNGFYEIRKEITKLGYKILSEELILDKKITYLLVVFIRGKKKYSYKELFFGPILLKKSDKLFKQYYEEELSKQRKILTNIPRKYIIKRNKLRKEIYYINKIIN